MSGKRRFTDSNNSAESGIKGVENGIFIYALQAMLKENWRLVSRVERIGDFIIIIAAFFVAYYGRSFLVEFNSAHSLGLPFEGVELAPLKDYFIVLIISLLSYFIVLNSMGAYTSMRFSSSLRLIYISFVSSSIVFLVLAAMMFLFKIDLSRSFISIYCILISLSLAVERYAVLQLLRFWRKRGRNYRNLIICGIGEQSVQIASEISSHRELGIRIRGFGDLEDLRSQDMRLIHNFRRGLRSSGFNGAIAVISGVESMKRALKDYAVDEVIFADAITNLNEIEEVIEACSDQGIRTTLVADLFSMGMVKSEISYFNGLPLIHFQTPPGDRWELGVKRVFDIVASSCLLVLLLPMLLLVSILVKLSSPGPAIFSQRRVGLNGRRFNLYKFRSMYTGSEKMLEKLKSMNEMDGPVFKMKNDPRVTAIGRILRRFSLDELPQLWNVLIGDMSLVGPRPPVPGEVCRYRRKYRRRLSMRPGITCTWQVSGRNEITNFDDWVELDLDYIDNWSLSRDMALIFRTIPAVFLGTGAR